MDFATADVIEHEVLVTHPKFGELIYPGPDPYFQTDKCGKYRWLAGHWNHEGFIQYANLPLQELSVQSVTVVKFFGDPQSSVRVPDGMYAWLNEEGHAVISKFSYPLSMDELLSDKALDELADYYGDEDIQS